MRTEMKLFWYLKVGKALTEIVAQKMASYYKVKIPPPRWVNTQKNSALAHCGLVVRDCIRGRGWIYFNCHTIFQGHERFETRTTTLALSTPTNCVFFWRRGQF